jgi:hypothetical protein
MRYELIAGLLMILMGVVGLITLILYTRATRPQRKTNTIDNARQLISKAEGSQSDR